MSISTESSEFVIHVPSEYDYRFSQVQHRNEIVKAIVYSNLEQTRKDEFRFFYTDEVNLTEFVTTMSMAKSNISKIP